MTDDTRLPERLEKVTAHIHPIAIRNAVRAAIREALDDAYRRWRREARNPSLDEAMNFGDGGTTLRVTVKVRWNPSTKRYETPYTLHAPGIWLNKRSAKAVCRAVERLLPTLSRGGAYGV